MFRVCFEEQGISSSCLGAEIVIRAFGPLGSASLLERRRSRVVADRVGLVSFVVLFLSPFGLCERSRLDPAFALWRLVDYKRRYLAASLSLISFSDFGVLLLTLKSVLRDGWPALASVSYWP